MSSPFKVFQGKPSSYDVEQIIRSNNIVEVAKELGLKVNKTVIPCIHQNKHSAKRSIPTMSFNPVNNMFKCWVCSDVGGNVIDLVMQVKGVDETNALQYLTIRGESTPNLDRSTFYSSKKLVKLDDDAKESLYKGFLHQVEENKGIDLIAFASIKGGTGKTMVVNNLSVLISLIARYIGKHKNIEPQSVEVVDLDLGKPDQRILFNSEPEYFIEDIFYNRDNKLNWNDIRTKTAIDNLSFVSACPVRKANSMYYLNKSEILYMLHNSDALIKLADFGGGAHKDALDFLGSMRNKIFVINPDRASLEAVFNLILSLYYYPLKKRFTSSKDAQNLLDNFRNYSRTGMGIEDLKFELVEMEKSNGHLEQFKSFYEEHVKPFRRNISLENMNGQFADIDTFKDEIPKLQSKMNNIMFSKNGVSAKYNYSEKSNLYKQFNFIKNSLNNFTAFHEHVDEIIDQNQLGLIMNKCEEELALDIKEDLIEKANNAFSTKLTYLGNIPEEKDLRNISNYEVPFILSNINHSVGKYFFNIADKLIGLKSNSTESIVSEQKDYINSLKSTWNNQSRHNSIIKH